MRVAAVLMMVALLFPALAYANEVQEGSARAPNESVDLIGGVDLGNRWPIFVDSLGRMRVIPMAYNGTAWDSLRVNSDGHLYTYDRTKDDWQEELNIVNNGAVNNHFTSPVLDLRSMGSDKTILVSFGTATPLYLAVDVGYGATIGNRTFFRVMLGGTDPVGADATKGWRFLNSKSMRDSANVVSGFAIPLADSGSGVPINAPYARLHLLSEAQVDSVYVHIVGRP